MQDGDARLQSLELRLVRVDVLEQPDPLLAHDVHLRPELAVLIADPVGLASGLYQQGLVPKPRLLQLLALLVLQIDLLVDALDARLERAHALLVLHPVEHLLVLPVQPVHPVHLLLDLVVPLADLHLVLLDQLVLLSQLNDALVHGIPQLHVVRLGVEGVDLDPCELVLDVRRLDLLLVHSGDQHLLLLGQVLRGLVARDLLVPVHRDALLQRVPLPDRDGDVLPHGAQLFSDNHPSSLDLHLLLQSALHAPLQHGEPRRNSLPLRADLGHVVVYELRLGLEPVLDVDKGLVLGLALQDFTL
mmetsp:Transcript_13022/g.26686  ORF Transcript_13022/g.26686 Transcript_13022/m.26686 type:complete len:302 (-) Transcript_13022:1072-1977(-)